MQIRKRIKTAQPTNEFEKSLEEEFQSFSLELAEILNGGIRLEDNFSAQIIDIADTGAADSENTVAHTLKRVPIGFIVLNTDKAGVVYDSGTAWTDTNIYIKDNVANCSIKIMVV